MSLDFKLHDPKELFGNEAADHEDAKIFESYAVHRSEVSSFVDLNSSIQAVRAYKGEGKSALLRLVETTLKSQVSPPLVIRTTSQALSPTLESDDSDQWVREWKRSILRRVAQEIGAAIKVAVTDDAISLVEEAERDGFKERSLVSAVTDRLKFSGVPERARPVTSNLEPVVRRWLDQGSPIWIVLDDLDQNFKNESKVKLRVASCFIAAGQLVSQIPEIRVRLAVRPNVWAIIKQEFEALSHLEQYMVDLSWPELSFLDILARRIEGFLKRTNQWGKIVPLADLERRKLQLIELLFESPVNGVVRIGLAQYMFHCTRSRGTGHVG